VDLCFGDRVGSKAADQLRSTNNKTSPVAGHFLLLFYIGVAGAHVYSPGKLD